MLFFLFDVCDKCNDFVFHYLLDYSCRVLLVDSVLILILKKPLISFNVCVCVENSFALVPFCRKVCADQHSAVVRVCSVSVCFLQAVRSFSRVCAPFYRNVCFLRVQDDCEVLPSCAHSLSLFAQSACPCFCDLASLSDSANKREKQSR